MTPIHVSLFNYLSLAKEKQDQLKISKSEAKHTVVLPTNRKVSVSQQRELQSLVDSKRDDEQERQAFEARLQNLLDGNDNKSEPEVLLK